MQHSYTKYSNPDAFRSLYLVCEQEFRLSALIRSFIIFLALIGARGKTDAYRIRQAGNRSRSKDKVPEGDDACPERDNEAVVHDDQDQH